MTETQEPSDQTNKGVDTGPVDVPGAATDVIGDLASAGSERVYIARAAVCILRLSENAKAMFTTPQAHAFADQIQQSIEAALGADSRVTEVIPHISTRDVDNARTHTYWEVKSTERKLTDALVQYEGLRLNQPITFRVRVPAKNQPLYRSMSDIPADDYLALWDGSNLIVQWDQESPRSTGSGGHIVQQIIEELSAKIDPDIEIIACAHTCHHRFVHADFVTFDSGPFPEKFEVTGEAVIGATVQVPFGREKTDLDNIRHLYVALQGTLAHYGAAKTLEGTIRFLDWRARRDAAITLDIAYSRASRRRFPAMIGALKDRWDLLGSRRLSRELMAGLWLALVSIETNKANWSGSQAHLDRALSESGLSEVEEVFDVGRKDIDSQNISIVRDSVQELASRSEGRQLLGATIGGALAAIAGAVLTVIASGLWK